MISTEAKILAKDLVIETQFPRPDVALVKLTGVINSKTFDSLEEAMAALMFSGLSNIIMDLSGLKSVSSSGAGILLNTFQEARSREGFLVILNPSSGVTDVLDLLNFGELLPVVDDIAAAMLLMD
jgi:anti-anti-sigma factor